MWHADSNCVQAPLTAARDWDEKPSTFTVVDQPCAVRGGSIEHNRPVSVGRAGVSGLRWPWDLDQIHVCEQGNRAESGLCCSCCGTTICGQRMARLSAAGVAADWVTQSRKVGGVSDKWAIRQQGGLVGRENRAAGCRGRSEAGIACIPDHEGCIINGRMVKPARLH